MIDSKEKAYQPLKNKEAIISFNGKNLLTTQSYLDVKAYQHALAFTVAKMMDEDLLADTRGLIQSAMETGTDFHESKKQLLPQLMSKGWLRLDPTISKDTDFGAWLKQNKFISNRLRTIFHTNLQTSYAAGQWQRIQETKTFLPFLQYMPSLATHKREEHKKYYGICRPADDPIWKLIFAPNGYYCECWMKQLTKSQADKVGISPETKLNMVDYTNPKTGETYKAPEGIEPSFAHNFDRFTAQDIVKNKPLPSLPTSFNSPNVVTSPMPANIASQNLTMFNQLASIVELATEKHGTDFGEKLIQRLAVEMAVYAEQNNIETAIDFVMLAQLVSNILTD